MDDQQHSTQYLSSMYSRMLCRSHGGRLESDDLGDTGLEFTTTTGVPLPSNLAQISFLMI